MNRRAFRLVIVLAAISIVGVLIVQLFWVGKAFDLRDKQFSHNVNTALLNSVTRLCELNGNEISPDPIEQLSTNYFIVNLNNKISPGILESVLRSEFTKREITNDFEYGIFDCASEVMVYGNYISFENKEVVQPKVKFPELNKDAYYFGVYFPTKSADMAGQMWIWIFSSGILVIVVVFFSYTLFVILRQKQLSEIQTDFINNMTHEFKTPISTISISSEVLKKPNIDQNPERILNYANIIQIEASRLQKQVDRVLQIATLDDADIQLSKENVDVNQLIAAVCENVELTMNDHGGRIVFDHKTDLSEVKLDKLHFTNVIHNLVENAVKYGNNEDLLVTVITKSTPDGLEISISDNGIGMTSDQVKLIFKKFYRVPTGNVHNVKGFGLGLYYVKLIVGAHHGKIEVESTPHKGTVFTITLPTNEQGA
ncbi:MAG: HAMP domain-containing sensor histidine kinase [Cyclobacteriaceae bacterium]